MAGNGSKTWLMSESHRWFDHGPLPGMVPRCAFAKKPCEPTSRADIHPPFGWSLGIWDVQVISGSTQHSCHWIRWRPWVPCLGNLGKKWGLLSPFLQMEKGEPPIAWDANICKCQDMLGFKLPWPGASLFAQWSCGLVWCSARIRWSGISGLSLGA